MPRMFAITYSWIAETSSSTVDDAKQVITRYYSRAAQSLSTNGARGT